MSAFRDGSSSPTLATLAFVGFAAAVAVYLWTRPTVIAGDAAAATLMGLVARNALVDDRSPKATRADCDSSTTVGTSGAQVQCTLVFGGAHDDVHVELRYGRDGRIQGVPISRRLPRP